MDRSLLHCLLSLALVGAAACSDPSLDDPSLEDPYDVAEEGGGLAFDEEHPDLDLEPKADMPSQYEVPEWVRAMDLENPEIRVSLDGLSVHLIDRGTGLSRVYPTGPGALGQNSGKSFTPTGFFATSPDSDRSWWNISERFAPSYFGGFPFLRITTHNRNGLNTYGLHGPITYRCAIETDGPCPLSERDWFLVHDFVSHGCMRMRAEDIVELFFLIQGHESVPVTIQEQVELDPRGEAIVVDEVAVDWPLEFDTEPAATVYGELGERPAGWDACQMPADWPFTRYGC